ncbi:MAG: hypothetical protein M3277_06025 [Actinomycetota bacterium]|nr:hypothetical protein [Actinomycetota bacterium]
MEGLLLETLAQEQVRDRARRAAAARLARSVRRRRARSHPRARSVAGLLAFWHPAS